jgi:hypothetical protein
VNDLTGLNDVPRRSSKETSYGTKLRFSATPELLKRLERLQAYNTRIGAPTTLSHVFDECVAAREAELESLGVLPPLD